MMGCIRAETRRIGGDVIISTERQGGDIQFTATQIGGNIRINTSLVCSIDPTRKFLKIEPEFIWLTESNNFTEIINILSNTDWRIE